MKKTILFLIAAMSVAISSHAQYKIVTADGIQEKQGNLRFEKSDDGSWSLAGIPLKDVKSVSRIHSDGVIHLDQDIIIDGYPMSRYFGDNYNDKHPGTGLYRVLLTNDDLGSEEGTNVPLHEGGYMLDFDIYAPVCDHNNIILPEGTYTLTAEKGAPFTIYSGLSWICHNTDGTYGGLRELLTDFGTLKVEHTGVGLYKLTGDFTTDQGVNIKADYSGTISFTDLTEIDDEEKNAYILENVTIEPAKVLFGKSASTSTNEYDDCVLRLFTTPNVTGDNNHCAEPGIKMQISFLASKEGIAGSYTPGTIEGWSLVNPKAGQFYPGTYSAFMPYDSFLEQVTDDGKVRTATLTDGSLKISANEDGTYTIEANFQTSNFFDSSHYTATCTWTGRFDNAAGASVVTRAHRSMIGVK